MAKVINLRVENILGVRKVEANPDGRSVAIGGENGQGKSSLQQALKMMLGGKDFVPPEPVRRGAEKGTGHLELDNGYSIDFAVTPDRKTKLKIRNRENPGFASDSVTLLKSLFGELSFDPGEWMAKDKKGKLDTLRALTGLDFAPLNARRERLYAERTDAGREVKRLEGQLSGLQLHDDAPAAEVSMSDLVREIDAARKEIDQHDAKKTALETRAANVRRLKAEIEEVDAEIKRLQEKREKFESLKAAEITEGKALKAEIEAFVAPDYEGLLVRQGDLESVNRRVRENQRYREVEAELKRVRAGVAEHTEQLEKLDAEKRQLLADAPLPIAGLTFDEDDIRFNGSLWEQCSESEQWDVATAISFALNPQGVVFMSKSGGMSRKSRARVMSRAAADGVQLFMEVVEDADDVQIVIDHGEIVENRLEAVQGQDQGHEEGA